MIHLTLGQKPNTDHSGMAVNSTKQCIGWQKQS